MARPTVTIQSVADHYANRTDERIIEFSSGEPGGPGGPGGLISFKRRNDGSLSVDVYRLDEGVTVNVSAERSPR